MTTSNAVVYTDYKHRPKADNDRRRLLPSQVAPFVKLIAAIQRHTGSEAKTAELCNLGVDTLRRAKFENNLTSAQGHKILAAYRSIKHHIVAH
jgi:hypothetical protein